MTKEQILTSADAMVAHANNEPIEFQSEATGNWLPTSNIHWIDERPHRRAPKKLEEWEFDTSSEEQARELAEAVLANHNGEPVEAMHSDCRWNSVASPIFDPRWRYRPAPKSKTRPWNNPSDVPGPVVWIRHNGNELLLTGMRAEGICVSTEGMYRWSYLVGKFYSTDRKTWLPCEVTE